jgi:glutathione synthase/RimK-type ligase-like ATP-grasp enzyme
VLIGIHADRYGRFYDFMERYEHVLDFNNIEHIRLDVNQHNFWEKVAQLDLFIFRWRHSDHHHHLAHTILPIIEKDMGIKCFPNQATCWHFDDKIRQYYLLKNHGFPIIDSWIFWEKKEALQWIKKAQFPLIFKLRGGAGSSNVVLMKNKHQATKMIHLMFGKGVMSEKLPMMDNVRLRHFNIKKEIRRLGGNILRKIRGEDPQPAWQINKNYVLFQKYLPNNNYDTRVVIIGERAFAFRRFTRAEDFRASGSGKLDMNKELIDLRCVKLALDISKKMGFQSMAYDFLLDDNNEPQFCEISYTYFDEPVYSCPGYWDSSLAWHDGHYWPQYFQLMDALELPGLQQPEMV